MKHLLKTIFCALLALCLVEAPAFASLNQADITNMNNAEPPLKNSRDHGYKIGVAKCVFDTATVANRAIGAHGCGLTLPAKALVRGAWYKVLTTFTSASDAGTIAIHIVAANDVFTATAISSGTTWDAAGAIEGTPKIETTASWLTTTVPSEVTFTVASEALTAGKMVVWVEYLYYGDA